METAGRGVGGSFYHQHAIPLARCNARSSTRRRSRTHPTAYSENPLKPIDSPFAKTSFFRMVPLPPQPFPGRLLPRPPLPLRRRLLLRHPLPPPLHDPRRRRSRSTLPQPPPPLLHSLLQLQFSFSTTRLRAAPSPRCHHNLQLPHRCFTRKKPTLSRVIHLLQAPRRGRFEVHRVQPVVGFSEKS